MIKPALYAISLALIGGYREVGQSILFMFLKAFILTKSGCSKAKRFSSGTAKQLTLAAEKRK